VVDWGSKRGGLTFKRSREEALGIRLLERGVIDGAVDLEGIDEPVVVLGLLDCTVETEQTDARRQDGGGRSDQHISGRSTVRWRVQSQTICATELWVVEDGCR